MIFVKYVMLIIGLSIASIIDIKTHRVPILSYIILVISGSIEFNFIESTIGLLSIFIPLLIVGIKTDLGGGDIKLGGLCGFVLGIDAAVGIILGCVVCLVINTIKMRKTSIAMVPYFSLGIFLVLLSKWTSQ